MTAATVTVMTTAVVKEEMKAKEPECLVLTTVAQMADEVSASTALEVTDWVRIDGSSLRRACK